MAVEQQASFIEQIPPFDDLPPRVLNEVAAQMDVVYFPVGSEVSERQQESGALYFVIKGRISEYHHEEKITQYGVRSFFGEQRILQHAFAEAKSHNRFIVEEEAILYRLPGEVFSQILKTQPEFERHFRAGIVEKLNALHQSVQTMTSTEVMMDTVCSAPIRPLLELDERVTLAEAVARMVEEQTDTCVVKLTDQAEPRGILTSTDIMRIIAAGDFHEQATLGQHANTPLITVHQFDYLFNALLKMTKYQIERLVVRSDSGLTGFLTQKDMMGLFANQSGLALLKIEQAESVGDFQRVAHQIDELVINLHRKGIKTHYIAKLVNELHRKLMTKLFARCVPESLWDRVCLLVMGSEGRSEQVLRTDQDNALFYTALNPEEETQLKAGAERFSRDLVAIGFPECPGGIMVSSPLWRQPVTGFKQQLKQWFDEPSEEHFMQLSIFSDAQPVLGNEELLKQAKGVLQRLLREQPLFLRHFAKAALQFETPIGFFGGLKTDKRNGGERIDLKKAGIFPIVHGVRCLALEKEVGQTNTHWRIKALMDLGVFEADWGQELGETLNFFHSLRLEAMLEQRDAATEAVQPDNFIDIQRLTHLQQDLLKQALVVVNQFKKRLRQHFRLHEVM